MIDAVLFDMDGLLLDSERLCRAAFLRVAPDRPDVAQFYPWLIGHRGQTNRQQLADWLGSQAQATRLYDRWGDELAGVLAGPIPLKPGAAELLRLLHGQGMPLAVVTSTRRAKAEAALRRAGLWPFLGALIGGDDVTQGKPDPEPYLAGAARLGVAPERCAAFEDSPTGVRSAVAAGCIVAQIPDIVPGDSSLGAVVADDLRCGARALGLIV